MNYVPLWIKTDYTLLSSLIKIDDLINKLSSLNMNACAICDDNLYGVMEFYNTCLNNNIKPIIGLEIDFDYKILLYAKNYEGYQNLCNIDSLKSEKKLNEENIKDYLDNILIVLPYEYISYKNKYEKFNDNIFVGYKNNDERDNISGNKVYIKKTLSLSKESEKYLKYLYKIGDKEFTEENVYLEEMLDATDIKNTLYFANLCNLKIEKKNDLLPIYTDNAFEYLSKLCIKGLDKRLNGNITIEYKNRLNHELNIINKMGFCNYFLVVWDYVKYAKKNNILVGVRGSAASSLVSYSLGITDIDPLKYSLLFERFLNPERVTMPDIDIDFDAVKRQDVIKYVEGKYGKDKVSGIITFSNLLAKQVIRDVARILDINGYKIDNLVSNFSDKKTLVEQFENISVKNIINSDEQIRKAYDIAMHLEGIKRHTSQHAAGIIISSKKLSNYVPLLNNNGEYLCGYTMNYIEELGLLKMDFLGLKNLTIIDNIINKIDGLKFNDIPLDDKDTFEIFNSGLLEGIFQFETSGMKKFISDLKPQTIEDLIAAVALFRPGPIDNIPSFINRRNGKEKIEYVHEDLEEILSETYGIIVYQEQIMQIASKLAGFSFGEADILRRAMSKKKENILISMKKKFIDGCTNNGYSIDVSEKIYNLILKFANYGFNKAHSVAYAIVGYKIAYLKCHYPKIFMCEMLNNASGVLNKTKSLVNECKKMKIKVEKPTINNCSYMYQINGNNIVYSLSMVKEIGSLICKQIVDERENNGLFKSYLDVVKRLYKLGPNILKSLILTGLLDEFKISRKTMVENLDEVINYADLCNDLDDSLVAPPVLKEYEEYTNDELTTQEERLYGMYLSNHPTDIYISENSITTDKISNYFDKNINIILYFERKNEINTKKGDKMMFVTASDSYGSIDLVMFPRVYEKYFNIKVPGIYKVSGKVEKRFADLQIVVNNVEIIKQLNNKTLEN